MERERQREGLRGWEGEGERYGERKGMGGMEMKKDSGEDIEKRMEGDMGRYKNIGREKDPWRNRKRKRKGGKKREREGVSGEINRDNEGKGREREGA